MHRLLLIALRVFLLLALPLLASCGGGEDSFVQYDGSTLKVAGAAYQKSDAYPGADPSQIEYAEGFVIVEVIPGQVAAFGALLIQLGLPAATSLGGSSFEVAVPAGWELQWVAALRAQAPVAWVGLDLIAHAS